MSLFHTLLYVGVRGFPERDILSWVRWHRGQVEISECSVFGVPDDRLGEEVGVIIYLVPESAKTVSEIREFCFAHIAKHKVPKYIWFSDSPLPRNANGKFLKRELRESVDLKDAL